MLEIIYLIISHFWNEDNLIKISHDNTQPLKFTLWPLTLQISYQLRLKLSKNLQNNEHMKYTSVYYISGLYIGTKNVGSQNLIK